MQRRHAILFAALLLGACDSAGGTPDTVGQCGCESGEQTALQTRYDPSSSTLGAENVQDAIDELAARQTAEQVIAERVVRVQETAQNPGTVEFDATLDCPDPDHDLAIGGGCDEVIGGTLRGQGLFGGGIVCRYKQSASNTATARITVVCLKGSR